MKITLIGDPHGKTINYNCIVSDCEQRGEKTLTVGDNGFEKQWVDGEKFLNTIPNGTINHKWLGGNHDVYPNNHFAQSLGDFGVWNGIFFVRGANSIDKAQRIEGRDWFREEEMDYSQMLECFDLYESVKPEIVVSHDCPQSVMEFMFGYTEKSRTRTLLEEMFRIHQPKTHLFGHHHCSREAFCGNTEFICLKELETLTLEI